MLQRVIENARKEAAQALKHVLFNSIVNNLKERSVKTKIASKLEGVANITENRDKREEQRRLPIQEGNKETKESLLRKCKVNYMEKNNMKKVQH